MSEIKFTDIVRDINNNIYPDIKQKHADMLSATISAAAMSANINNMKLETISAAGRTQLFLEQTSEKANQTIAFFEQMKYTSDNVTSHASTVAAGVGYITAQMAIFVAMSSAAAIGINDLIPSRSTTFSSAEIVDRFSVASNVTLQGLNTLNNKIISSAVTTAESLSTLNNKIISSAVAIGNLKTLVPSNKSTLEKISEDLSGRPLYNGLSIGNSSGGVRHTTAYARLINSIADFIEAYGDARTKALLHFNGTNGSGTIVDEVGGTWTLDGGAVLSTAKSRFGTASLLLNAASNQSLSYSVSRPYNSTGWTEEGSFYPLSVGSVQSIFTNANLTTSYGFYLAISANNKLYIYASSNGTSWDIANNITGTATIAANAWYDWSITFTGTQYIVRLNGVTDIVINSTSAIYAGLNIVRLGRNYTGSNPFNGYIDEYRYSDVAKYSADYSVAAAEFAYTAPALNAVVKASVSEPLGITIADGFSGGKPVDYAKEWINDITITGLVANATNYLYVEVDRTTGNFTFGSTTTAPTYATSGTPSFNISKMKVSSGNPKYYFAEADTNATSVITTRSYAVNGLAIKTQSVVPNSAYAIAHNIGTTFIKKQIDFLFGRTVGQMVPGDVLLNIGTVENASYGMSKYEGKTDKNNYAFKTQAAAVFAWVDSSSNSQTETTGQYRITLQRIF